jgi:hypothetical protein
MYILISLIIFVCHEKMKVQPARLFNAIGCWDNYKEGFETLQPLQQSFFEEIDSFLRCSSHAHLTSTENNVDMSLESQLQLLDEDIDKCIKIKGGISKQYIYRSIYAAQLFNCFKVRVEFCFLPYQFFLSWT